MNTTPKERSRKKKGRPRGRRSWLPNLRRIKAHVQASNAPFLDRRDIERLFSMGPRRAQDLLRELRAERLAGGLVVSREALLQFLHLTQRRLPYLTEVVRRRSIAQVLREAQLDVAARAVRFKVAPAATAPRAIASLPPTIRFAPGELHITCQNAQDLLEQLFALVQALPRDFPTFEELVRIEGERPRQER